MNQEKIIIDTDLSNTGELVIYQTTDGQTKIDVKMVDETARLTQKDTAALFGNYKRD